MWGELETFFGSCYQQGAAVRASGNVALVIPLPLWVGQAAVDAFADSGSSAGLGQSAEI
jgi:hypothetical protein